MNTNLKPNHGMERTLKYLNTPIFVNIYLAKHPKLYIMTVQDYIF